MEEHYSDTEKISNLTYINYIFFIIVASKKDERFHKRISMLRGLILSLLAFGSGLGMFKIKFSILIHFLF
jgi:hypothetical protein